MKGISKGKTIFIGIEYTNKQGNTILVKPDKEIKKEVETKLNNYEAKIVEVITL